MFKQNGKVEMLEEIQKFSNVCTKHKCVLKPKKGERMKKCTFCRCGLTSKFWQWINDDICRSKLSVNMLFSGEAFGVSLIMKNADHNVKT